MPIVRRWLTAQTAPYPHRLDALRLAAAAVITLLVMQWASAQQIAPYVDGLTLVSSQRFDRDRSDFVYRIRVINPGGALVGASAFVTSSSANTVIVDNEVTIGTLAAGSTFNSTDTFTLRQNRTVAFNPASLSWRILGTPANTRPVANAGPNQTTATGQTVTLDGTASSDADGNPLTYRWRVTSRPGGSASVLSASTAARPTFRIDRGGTYEFELIVNDGRDDSAPATVQISTINAKPIANAGADRTVPRAARVTLDGSASRDPDFDALNYRWTIVSAPLGSTATFVDASLVSPTITLDRNGAYRFRLTVSDSRLDSDPDEVVISTENSAPLANAGPDQSGTLTQRITLDGSASSDADGDPISLAWSWVSRPAGSTAVLDITNILRPVFTPDRNGLYTVQLIVNDGYNSSAADTVTVTVAPPPNRAPNAVADTASTPANTPVDIAVLGNDTDPDGDALTVQSFTQSASGQVIQVGSALCFTPATGFSGPATFDYVISDGAQTATARVTITVAGATNLPPLVNAGADRIATPPYPNAIVTVQLSGTVTDDGRPAPPALTSSWTRVSGPGPAFIATPNSPGTAVDLGAPGVYLFRLSASDGLLAGSDDVAITLAAATNTAPQLGDLPDRTVRLGDTIHVQLAADDSDPFDTLTFLLGAVPAGTTLSSTGLLTWTAGSTTPATFTVNVRDRAGLTDSDAFVVTVQSTNRPPVFGVLADDTTVVGAAYGKSLSASDPDGGPVSFELLGGPAGLTLNGSTIAWRAGASQTGPSSVKVQARDGGGATAVGLFRVTVSAVTPPLARDDLYQVKVGETLTVSTPGVLGNDVSPAGTPLSALRRNDPALGSLSAFNANGSFTYTAPAADPKPPFSIVGSLIGNAAAFRNPSGLAPLLGDLNQDGRPDLVYFGYSGPTAVATAISGGTGQALWRDIGGLDANACENNLGNYPGYVLGDIEDDGQVELVTVTGCRSGESGYQRLAAFRADGSRKWVSALLTPEIFDVRCVINSCAGAVPTRIDYDLLFESALSLQRLAANEAPVIMARAEIPATAAAVYTELSTGVFGYKYYGCRIVTGVESDMGQACNVTILMSGTDGRVLQVLRSPVRPQFNRGIPISPFQHNPPIAADLDGDGSVEIISGADVWRRVAGTWMLAWQGDAEPEQVAVADLDGDGRQEVIWALDRNQNLAASTPYLGFVGILIFDANGQELRRIPLPSRFPGMMTVADIDGDRAPEILVTEAGILHALGTDGSYRWSYLVPDNPVYPQLPGFRTSYRNNVVVYDLDGDGNSEVIFSSAAGVHFLEGRTGIQKAFFPGGTRYAGIQASNTTFVTDWDNDGRADIVSFAEVGAYATESFAYVISAANDDWLPAGKIHNQVAFQPSSVNEAGRVLFDPSIARSYRNPRQLGTVRDPRETAGTSFGYAANDGVTDSANARVFLAIKPQNSPPVFTSRAPTAIQSEGFSSTVTFQATTVDPDAGDTVTYSLNAVGTNGLTGPSIYIDVNPATGLVSIVQSTGFSYFTYRVTLTATDSQGASATQTFVVRHETRPRVGVPNVVGTALLAATQALTAVDLQSTVLQEQYSPLPAGQVMAQNPSAGSNQTRGTTVLLTVSKGPAPAIVPNVVGLLQGQANTRLLASGFSTGAVTRQFSATVPRGEVIAQSTVAGTEQVPGPVSIVISAGNGLALRLNNAVTTANAAIAYVAVSTDLAGMETPATGLTYAIVPLQAPIGPNPIVTGSSLLPASATRGAFRLTITDGGGRSASAEFAVSEPALAGEAEPMAAAFLRLSAALDDIDELLRQARDALTAGDVPRQTSLLRQMVLRWRQVDLVDLELSIPLSPERGFAPLVSQMAGFGVNPTPDDLLSSQILKDADQDLKDWIEGLTAANTPMAVLDQQAERFGSRAARLNGLVVTEWGMVNNSSRYTILLARRIPALYEAIMNELAQVPGVGLPATRTAALGGPAPNDGSARSLFAGSVSPPPSPADHNGPQLNSTLAELAVTQATQWVVDKVIEDFNAKYKNGKQFATDIMTQAFSGAAIVAAVSHLRQFVQGQDTGTIVSGASLSFRVFEAPYSFIEGPWDLENPEMNKVFIIGPSLVTDVQPFITKFKDAMKFRQTLNPLAEDGKYKAAKEIKRDLKDFKKALEDLLAGTEALVETIRNIEQTPTGVDRPCVFDGAPDCGQLLFDVGFRSVYKYRPPPGFENFTGLPLPIVFIVYNYRNNTMYFSTPSYLPTLAPPPP